ncbi:hypothetical protein BOX15_Mlig019535g1 [Macrostomum lignano]|uniref:Uncharacterized protein n=3 Tax=Macrostomum lignano TaxID=282301 RepID=A0A267E197_9PLAT|nr:hypothetical protein BOX15_Mlig019535g1 [Macrostomum lignano]
MGNLTACAGGRSNGYHMTANGRKPLRQSHRSESMPAKPLSMLGRVRSLRRRRPDRQSIDEGEVGAEVDVSAENPTQQPDDSNKARDPVLEQLQQLKDRLRNGDLQNTPAAHPPHSVELSPAAAARQLEQSPDSPTARCLSYVAPSSDKRLFKGQTTAPTLTPEMAENFSEAMEAAEDKEVSGILKQQTDAQPADSPPPKPPKPTRGLALSSREKTRACRSAPSTPTFLRASCDVALASGLRTPPPKPPRHISRQRSRQKLPQRPLPIPAVAIGDSLAERRARPNTPDSLDGCNGEAENPVVDKVLQEDTLKKPTLRKRPSLKEATRPTSKSVFNLADPSLMDTSLYENADWDGQLAVLRPTCFGSTMCHMDHLAQAASRELLHQAGELASAADTGQLTLPLESRSRAARQILSRAFVQSLPIGGADFLRLCRARGCLSEQSVRELLKTPNSTATARAERFVQLFDWSETSLRKLAQCLTVGDVAGGPFYQQFSAILHFLADLFALLAAKHLFAQPDSRAGKRKRVDAFLRGVHLIDGDAGREEDQHLRCQIQLLYLSNSNEQSIAQDAKLVGELGRHREARDQLSARKVAAVNEPDWLCSNFSPALSLDLTGSGVNAWFFKQLVGKSLQPVVELSLAGCDLDSGLLPTLVLTQRSSRLRVLCLAGAALGDESLSALCLLPQQQLASLEVLDLSACGITQFGLSLLAGCLPVTLPLLADLDLSWNDLSEATPATVAGLFDPAAGLSGIRLRGCRLASDALRAIVDSLPGAAAANLRVLDLSDNRMNCLILARLAERFERGTKGGGGGGGGSGRLSELGLAGVNLFATDLQKLLSSGGCDGCRRLDFGRNHLGEAGAGALAARLPRRLESLAVNSCRLGGRGLRRLLEAAKISAPRLRLVRAANNLRNRRGADGHGSGMGAEEKTLRQEIAEAAEATGGRLRFLVDDEVQQVERGFGSRQQRRAAAGGVGGSSGGSLRRSLRRLASLD